jgi:hypothetical protein
VAAGADNRAMSRHLPRPLYLTLLLAPLMLGGCDLLGIETPEQIAAKREADGRAIGAGCRHSARSVEACFELNKRADKAAVFAGWKEMNEYMVENKLEAGPPPPPAAADAGEPDEAEPAKKSAADGKADDAKVAAKAPK